LAPRFTLASILKFFLQRMTRGALNNGGQHPRAPEPPARQPPRAALQPRVIAGIPVDAIRREVEGIVAVVGGRSTPRARQQLFATTQTAVDVEATATDEGDRLAQGSRDGGEKAFIIMKRHLRIPSPFGDRGKHRRRASPPAREHVRIGNMLPDR